MLTKNGICYDLNQSPYTYQVDEITYHFSSEFYRRKFSNSIKENRKTICESLRKRFEIDVAFFVLCDIVLYSKIEKRGFYITCSEGEILCKENLILHGEKVNNKSYQEVSQNLTQK